MQAVTTTGVRNGAFERYDHASAEAALARVELLARLMDSAFTLPGSNVRIGLDAIIGLVPVLGDLISQAIASYIIWEARRLGVSRWTVGRMIANSAIDTVVGFIPVVGDLFDVGYRANMKNLALLKSHLEKPGMPARGPTIAGTAHRL
jgi:Domain of unknown function (DUF4112)